MSEEQFFVGLEPTIIAACVKHEKDNHALDGYRRLIRFDDYFVKFGDSWCFSSEVETHNYIYGVAEKDSKPPRVASIRHSFKHGYLTFAIIEPIQTIVVTEDVLSRKIADAVLWMRSQACPPGVALGPLGSGPICHAIFRKKYAPLVFTSVAALEKYMNQALSTLHQHRHLNLSDISISGERLVLTQSDMHPSNFGVDVTGRVIIFDFGEIGWLPESLANYTLLGFDDEVATLVFGEDLESVRASPNIASLGAVKKFLGTGGKVLGLDKDGNPINPEQSDIDGSK